MLLALFAPRSGGAAGREVGWEKVVLQRAQERYDALGSRLCADVALDAEAPEPNRAVAAESLQIAAVFDFVARHYPEKMADRALHIAFFVDQAVKSYERAFACAPSHEGRRTLEAAIALVNVVLPDLEKQPAAVRDKYRAEFQGYVDRVERQMPVGRRSCPPQRASSCEGPPAVEKSGCAVAGGEPSGAALVLLALGTCGLRRRRRATKLASLCGPGRGARAP